MKFSLFLIIQILLLTSCSTYRLITYNFPGNGDQYIFPSINFPASPTPQSLPTSYTSLHFCPKFQHFLCTHNTLAFLMIQNDTLRIEYYAPSISPSCRLDLFSISKSIVAEVIAVACQEGYFSSLSDTLGQYLKKIPPRYASISIRDLLNMRSGIQHSIYYTTRLYYSHNLSKTLSHIPTYCLSGEYYGYSNADTQWLVTLFEEVTKKKFADYFYQKIWHPLHMENPGSWTLDSRRYQTVRGFCGLNLCARDLAKIGLCYLHDGYYHNQSIIPVHWVNAIFNNPVYPNPTPEGTIYNMHWRLLSSGQEILAKGLRGQYLYLNKKTNTLIIRLGTRESSVEWLSLFHQLIASLSSTNDFSKK